MAELVVLHVGLMKSGTSFIQEVLRHNREALQARGVLFPSPWRRQVLAVRDVIAHGDGDQPPLADDGPWRSLVAEVDAWPGTAVVSMEFLGPRGPSKAGQLLADLAPARIEVVISVRDLARTIPAMWQESLQNRGTRTWSAYLEGVKEEDRSTRGPGQAFWARQDAPGITRSWQRAAGRDHVSVLTVPPAGAPPELLWERFASVVGVDSAGLDLAVRSNPSLGLASLMVLRRLNERLAADDGSLTPGQYERVVKRLVAKRGLAGRVGDPRLGYDADWVPARAERDLERLRELAPRVVGDLEELRCRPVPGSSPEQVPVAQQLEAAIEAVHFAVVELAGRMGPGDRDRDNSDD